MSRRIDICPTCKGKGEIIVDNWLTEGMTEEEIAKEKEKALADIVEVVRCKDCKRREIDSFGRTVCIRNGQMIEIEDNGYCSYGERKEDGKS